MFRKLLGLFIAIWLLPAVYADDQKVKVVASFSLLGDIVSQIGGDRINLTVLVGPDEDGHVFRPSPSDARSVKEADVLVMNGLGFEGWLPRLIESSGFEGERVVASDGAKLLTGGHDHHADEDEHGEQDSSPVFDPHAWHDIDNVRQYVANITNALVRVSDENRSFFNQNANRYLTELDALNVELTQKVNQIPVGNRRVITSHDAFQYLAHAYDFEFMAPQGVTTESQPSAKDMALLIRQIKQSKVKAVFVENITDERLVRQIARETGVAIQGTLYSGSLARNSGPTTYVELMRHNIDTLVQALQ